jgi:transcriptional regulator with XRE-family HTH domain
MSGASNQTLARKIFASRLSKLMEDHEVSQAELASATGLAQQTISRYLRGLNEPRLADLAAICVFFNVSPEAFLDSTIRARALTSAAESIEMSALLGPTEAKQFRDLFQILQSKLVTLKPDERKKYLQAWISFAHFTCLGTIK